MKNTLLKSILIVSTFSSGFAWAAEEGEAPKARIGPGKAILEATMENGLRLSEKAVLNLEIQLSPIKQSGSITVPTTALVKFQDFYAVYRKRDGWFKMVEVEPQISNGVSIIFSKELKVGDELVVANAELLRVVDLDVWGPEADACVD